MCPLELICSLGPKQLHQEEDQISDVALNELVDEARSLDLIKNWIDLVCLLTHVLKYVVDFTGVKHLFFALSLL